MLKRNVIVLSVAQAFGSAGLSMMVLLGGIIGAGLAPSRAWATLPVAIMVLGMALASVPAALLMQRVGRRLGFTGAAALGAVAAGGAALAVARSSFGGFILAGALIGVSSAFMQQYRFAAAENAAPGQTARTVSFVLLANVVSGFLGPELGRRGQNWFGGHYAGSFISLAAIYVVALVALTFYRDVRPPAVQAAAGRTLRQIVTQRSYLVAVFGAAGAFWVMSLIMTATPVHLLQMHGFDLTAVTRIIQSHIAAMFVPSLFTGLLLERLGIQRMMLLGASFLAACVLLSLIERDFVHYLGALVLLGLGWNFLFVASTVLLTRTYLPGERFRAQAANDLVVFFFQGLASLSAGAVLFATDWRVFNLANLPLLAALVVAVLWLGGETARTARSGVGRRVARDRRWDR